MDWLDKASNSLELRYRPSAQYCDGAGAPSPAASLAQYPEFARTVYILPLGPLSSAP